MRSVAALGITFAAITFGSCESMVFRLFHIGSECASLACFVRVRTEIWLWSNAQGQPNQELRAVLLTDIIRLISVTLAARSDCSVPAVSPLTTDSLYLRTQQAGWIRNSDDAATRRHVPDLHQPWPHYPVSAAPSRVRLCLTGGAGAILMDAVPHRTVSATVVRPPSPWRYHVEGQHPDRPGDLEGTFSAGEWPPTRPRARLAAKADRMRACRSST
jgi:hypothetical protein